MKRLIAMMAAALMLAACGQKPAQEQATASDEENTLAFGAEYIRMTAAVMKEKLPKEATVFRMGGDEFVALVPRTGKEAAADILENLIDHEKMFSVMGRALSVSFGTSTADDPDVRLRVTIEEADREMYRQKREKAAARGGSYPESDPVK